MSVDRPRRFEMTVHVKAPPDDVFARLDDPRRLSAHMTQPSWKMGGGRMSVKTDDGEGRVVGSHIEMEGRVLGVRLRLDEVVTERDPPRRKAWQTVGRPRLLVVGEYRMWVEVDGADGGSRLKIGIEYGLPHRAKWMGDAVRASLCEVVHTPDGEGGPGTSRVERVHQERESHEGDDGLEDVRVVQAPAKTAVGETFADGADRHDSHT